MRAMVQEKLSHSEQLFSRAGGGALSDDNGKMNPHRLAVWTSIGVNYSTYKPTDKEILERYFLKFSKGGKAANLHEDDPDLLDPGNADQDSPATFQHRRSVEDHPVRDGGA